MAHEITINWIGDMAFDAKLPGGEITLDVDESVGGTGKGVRPKPLMLTALAGCTGMDVVSLMKKMRLKVDKFYVDVKADLTEEHPKHYKNVEVHYYFEGSDLDEKKLKKCVDLSYERYCGVIYMFKQFTEVKPFIHFNGN
ncbi:MAG TPA: osmotically inducible protein OsmC [Flavobacteriales bacterium]|nr:osmotically inducible protein OsmC [Flavobacteriales bacterium]|tara:strand:- start:169 stop:588 length:420 start_codon:yes stop_codon:yes gene_type:complete